MILWNYETITALNQIVSYLKKSKIGFCLEKLANFYLERHSMILDLDYYAMNFSTGYIVDPSMISDGEYKLGFICEIEVLKQNHKNNTESKNKEIEPRDVYRYFLKMIKYNTKNLFQIDITDLKYREVYSVSIIKNVLIQESTGINSDDNIFKIVRNRNKYKNIISMAYKITKQLMEVSDELSLYSLESLLTETQNLDLTILTQDQMKNILGSLNTNRKLYLRILLVLSYTMIKSDYSCKYEFIKGLQFYNYTQFKTVINNPINEVLFYLIADNIIKENHSF